MIKLGVNIDHVATIRNARGELYPDPLKAAILAINSGANSVTIHLREDRRHIIDRDLFIIAKKKKIPLNLEISPNKKMINIAFKAKPNFICIVPENRKEITTEGGLNLRKNFNYLKKIIYKFNKKKIRTSLFVNPNINDLKLAKKIGTHCVELHTGKFCSLVNKNKNYITEFNKIKNCSLYANKIDLEVHAGHGMTYASAKKLSFINNIKEFNIGHFIVSESIFYGLRKTILKFKKIINK